MLWQEVRYDPLPDNNNARLNFVGESTQADYGHHDLSVTSAKEGPDC